MDDFVNNASANVSTGYSAGATSIVVETGFGARFPTPPFNAIWWNYEDYPDPDLDDDREIVRVTAISTDTLTITRAQEGTSATAKNIADKTYRIMAPLTAKTLLDDIEPLLLGTSRVTTVMIQNAAITLAKQANISTGSIMGRSTAGSGVPEVLTALPFALSGDISTVAGANVAAIGADKVLTAMIANSQVTLAKIANIATARVLGRASGGSGVVEELSSLPFAIDLSGSQATGILASARFPALTGDVTTSAGSVATVIGAAAVSLSKMAQMATDSILGRATAGTGSPEVLTALPFAYTGDVTRPADSNVLTIANDAVVTAKILDANVTLAKMANIATDSIIGRASASTGVPEVLTALPWAFTGDVTSAADANALTIANDAVTYAKMQNVSAASRLIGRGSASGAGDPEEITLGSGLTMTGTSLSASGGSAAGSDTQVQFNDGGTAFGGDAGFVYNKTNDMLSVINSAGANTAPTTAGFMVQNTTAASSGNQMYSPGIYWEGQGWKTTATAASQPVRFVSYTVPVQGSANPSGNWILSSSINSGAFSARLTVSSAGLVTANSSFQASTSGSYAFGSTRSTLKSSSDGLIELGNAAGTDFTRLNFGGATTSFAGIASSGTTLTVTRGDGTSGATFNPDSLTMSAGKAISITSGANQRAGDATLVGGTVTVNNTTVTANTRVFLTRKSTGGTIGFAVTYTVSAATSFTITSDNVLDTSVYSYLLIEVP